MPRKRTYQTAQPVYDRIKTWLADQTGQVKITERDHLVFDRIQTLRSLVTKEMLTANEALVRMVQTFSISEPTFWRDYQGTLFIYGDLMDSNDKGHRWILYEQAIHLTRMAAEKGDMKAAARFQYNAIVLKGYDKDNKEGIDPEKLNPGFYALVIDDHTAKILEMMQKKDSVIDLTQIMPATDIEYEEIKDPEPKRIDSTGNKAAGEDGEQRLPIPHKTGERGT